jgi:hypothetical protein
MANSRIKIAGAFLFGALLIIGAFILRSQNTLTTAGTVSVAPVGREYVPPKDSNGDGVPDWQEALVSQEALVLGTTSASYTEPTTITGRFGLRFFENYIRSKMYGPIGDSTEELVEKSTEMLLAQAVDELFTEKDIVLFDTEDQAILRGYGNQVASILSTGKTEENEALILQDYMRYEKPERLQDLEPIALSYTTMVKDLLEVNVPTAYAKEHLDLLNAVNAVREDVRAMQKIEEDSMYTLIRFKRYPDDVLGMSNAIKNLFNALYLQGGIRWDESEPVSRLMVFPS